MLTLSPRVNHRLVARKVASTLMRDLISAQTTGSKIDLPGRIWDTVVRAREAGARLLTTPRDRPRGSSPTNDNQFVVSPVQGLLPGSLQTVKRFQFTQSPKCTNKTIDFQTKNSLSVNLNVVKHVLSVKGLSQKKGVSPVIVTSCQEKLKSVKSASFVTHLSCVQPVKNVKNVATTQAVGPDFKIFGKLGRSKSGSDPERGLHPPLSDPTKTHKVPHSHKPLCQSSQEQLPVRGITSAYGQKGSGTSTEPGVPRVLQSTIFSSKTKQQVETYSGSEQIESFPQGGEIQNGDTGNHQDLPPAGRVGHLNRLQRRLLPHTNTRTIQEIPEISCPGSDLPVQGSAFRFGYSTLVVKEVKLMALHKGIRIHQYLDDWLVRATSHQTCLQYTKILVQICQDLGWLVNLEKSELEPKQVFDFVGYQFDLQSGRVRPTPERWQNLQQKILGLLSLPTCPVRDLVCL